MHRVMQALRVALAGTVLGGVAIAGLAHPRSTQANAALASVGTESTSTASSPGVAFVTIENQDETMTLQVPKTWTDVSQGPWVYHGVQAGYFLTASTDLADYRAGRAAPGVFMGVFSGHPDRSTAALLDAEKVDVGKRCSAAGRSSYHDDFYAGSVDNYVRCNGSQQRSIVSVVRSGDGSIVLLRVSIASAADVAVANQIFASFQVLGNIDEHDHGHGE